MEESDGGQCYLVTLSDYDPYGRREQVHFDGIKQYRVKHGSLFLYDEWREDEFGINCRLKAVYGTGCWFKMDRV